MKRFTLLWFLFVSFTLAFAGTIYAQEPTTEVTDDEVNLVARELYCPICENTPLDVCETQACQDWRDEVRDKLSTGWSEQEIIDHFADIYGERARATPTTEGLSLAVWIAPVLGAVIGVAYFARLMRRWLARGKAAESIDRPSPTPHPDDAGASETEMDDYVARLEREIHESP